MPGFTSAHPSADAEIGEAAGAEDRRDEGTGAGRPPNRRGLAFDPARGNGATLNQMSGRRSAYGPQYTGPPPIWSPGTGRLSSGSNPLVH